MVDTGKRDEPMDRLLTRALRPPASTDGPCPEAEVVAAYVERSLPASEAQAFELHAVSCARCQQVLATLADLPDPPAVEDARPALAPPSRWWSWRWLVPVGAAAALATVVLVVVRPSQTPELQMAGGSPNMPAPQAPAVVAPEAPARVAPREQMEVSDRPGPASAPSPPVSAPPAPAPPPVRPEFAQRAAAESETDAGRADAPSLVAEKTEDLRARADRDRARLEAMAEAQARLGDAAAANLAQQKAASPAAASAEFAPSPPPAPAAPAPAAACVAAAPAPTPAASGRTEDRAAGFTAVAAGPRWRAGPAGAIERSDDGGRSWRRQVSGVSVDLRVVAVVPPRTVWVAGVAGTVLLSTDGERWEVRSLPDRIDVVALAAAGPTQATVTTRDGRRYATTDGGRSWRVVP